MTRAALALLALTLLAGCGIKSGLERPGPLWGETAPSGANGEAAPADEDADDEDEDDVDYGAPPLPR
jgi:hypothetical protein